MSEIKHTPLFADAERVRLEDGTLIATVWVKYPSKDRLLGESWMEMMARTEAAREEAKQESIDRARIFAAAPTMYEYIESSAMNGCATAKKILEAINGNA